MTTTTLLRAEAADDPDAGRALTSAPGTTVASWPVRALIAAVLTGAACIHFAMAPSHAGEWLAEGITFAIAGWIQLACALLVLARPSRLWLAVTAVTNLVFIGAWAWTRIDGPPWGPEAGIAHPIGFVDLACVLLEAAAVVLVVVGLARPRSGSGIPRWLYSSMAVVPALLVVTLVSAAIVSPSATDHGHEEAGASGHQHSHGPELAGAGAVDESLPHSHGAAATTTGAATEVDDKGLALLHNGEMANHHFGPDEPLDARTRRALAHQLALTRLVVDRYPTLGDAKAAGSQPAGGFGPGMGIHMTTPRQGLPEVPPPDPDVPVLPGTLTDTELLRPANLLYDGITDDAPIAGLMYYAFTPDEPVGFAGPNDHWHTHGSLCIKMQDGIKVLHPAEKTNASCTAAGGLFVERTNWMVHVWTVPGYESNNGVFSDINPAIACADGTYYIVAEQDNAKYPMNKCRSNPS